MLANHETTGAVTAGSWAGAGHARIWYQARRTILEMITAKARLPEARIPDPRPDEMLASLVKTDTAAGLDDTGLSAMRDLVAWPTKGRAPLSTRSDG